MQQHNKVCANLPASPAGKPQKGKGKRKAPPKRGKESGAALLPALSIHDRKLGVKVASVVSQTKRMDNVKRADIVNGSVLAGKVHPAGAALKTTRIFGAFDNTNIVYGLNINKGFKVANHFNQWF